MATYLSRLVERASGELAPDRPTEAFAPVQEPTMPGPVDPFEETAEEELAALTPVQPDLEPRREPVQPDVPMRLPPVAFTPETTESTATEGATALPSALFAPPVPETVPAPEATDEVPAERIVIERWHDQDEPIIEMPTPAATAVEAYPLPVAAEPIGPELLPLPVAAAPPALYVPAAVQPSLILEALPQEYLAQDEIALAPPPVPPVEGHVPPGETGPTITIGDVVVEIVATKRSPEPIRKPAAPVYRAAERVAPRPGVRSKRQYGIGQS